MKATHQIGEGNFSLDLDNPTHDEIGEVRKAFNVMTQKLDEAKKELELRNQDLATNLDLTSQQKKDLEKVNKELDNFVHTVSHDLRSPLMGIGGYATILTKDYHDRLDERAQRCVLGMRRGVDRLSAMLCEHRLQQALHFEIGIHQPGFCGFRY